MQTLQGRIGKVVVAVGFLWLSTALGAFLSFLTQTLLARHLGPADFGLFSSSLATVTMIAPFAGFGQSQFWLRAYGVEGWHASRWLAPSLRFIRYTTSAAIVLVCGWAFFGHTDIPTEVALCVLVPVIPSVLAVDLVSAKLRLEERYRSLSGWQLAIPLSRLVVVLLAFTIPVTSGLDVAVGFSASAVIVLALCSRQLIAIFQGRLALTGHGARPRTVFALPRPSVSRLWAQAWPYGLSATLYPMFFQITTIMLKYLRGDVQAGRFALAMAVMAAIYLLPATIYQKFLLSKLHRWAVHDPRKFWEVYRMGARAMLFAGLVVGVGMATLSSRVVPLLFGERYSVVASILLILSVCPPLRFMSTAVGSALLSEEHMRYRVYAMCAATLITVLLGVLFIPVYEETGAAYAIVGGECVLLLSMAWGVRRMPVFQGSTDG